MACYNIYFSPTGGTKKVAALVANGLADTVSDVDLTDNRTDFPDLVTQKTSIL